MSLCMVLRSDVPISSDIETLPASISGAYICLFCWRRRSAAPNAPCCSPILVHISLRWSPWKWRRRTAWLFPWPKPMGSTCLSSSLTSGNSLQVCFFSSHFTSFTSKNIYPSDVTGGGGGQGVYTYIFFLLKFSNSKAPNSTVSILIFERGSSFFFHFC